MELSERRRYVPPFGFALLLLVASLVPLSGDGGTTLGGIGIDKWAHFIGYGTFAILLSRARSSRTALAVATVFAVAASYGLAIEVVQSAIPSRAFEGLDAVVNALGAGLGVFGWWVIGLRSRSGHASLDRP